MRLRDWGGRGVLITGAAGGIGRAFALRAAGEGARLALIGRTEATLERLCSEVEAAGGQARGFVCDVSDRSALAEVVKAAEQDLGPIDVGLLCAGVGRHRRLLEHPLSDVEQMVQTNLLGVIYAARLLAEPMVARGRGWLVFMSSIAGLVPVPGEAVYSATKHAVVGFADAASIELEPLGVHVLSVCPGAVRTGFVPESELGRMPEAAQHTMIEPEDVVQATWDALDRGARRVVIPKSLGVAVALRGMLPSVVRYGTARATRHVLEAPPSE